METLTTQTTTAQVSLRNFTKARNDHDAFLRWCREQFKLRFGKDLFFIVQSNQRDAKSMSEFLDQYMTNHLRQTLGANSSFYREIETIVHNKSRKQEMVDVRHMIMNLLHDTKITLTQIGILMGGRDHSTVIHALKAHNDLYQTNSVYRNQYEYLKQLCIDNGFIFTFDPVKNYSEPTVCTAEL